MYRQLMVPLDGSSFAEAALPLALSVSRHANAALHLVTVTEPAASIATTAWETAAGEWGEDYLRTARERLLAQAGGVVTTAHRRGHVVETLLAEARSHEADVVAMATHGRGMLSRAWIGSVADRFLRRANQPVLLIRPQEDVASPASVADVRTLLVPLDGSELSECALAHATEFGELFGSAYHLTRVVSYPLDIASASVPHAVRWMSKEFLVDTRAGAAEYLEGHAERMRRHGFRVTTSVALDPQAGRGILDEAEAVGCDAIAMATHGRTGFSRAVLGSAADKVLRGARGPLLLYRPSQAPA